MLCFLITACYAPLGFPNQQPADLPLPIKVRLPQEQMRLKRDEPFFIAADIDVPYQVEMIEVRLLDIESNQEYLWEFPRNNELQKFPFNQRLELPDTLAAGEYRLSIRAVPMADETHGQYGYSLRVQME
jgi:hypothetical protein